MSAIQLHVRDSALVYLAKAGDKAAFAELVAVAPLAVLVGIAAFLAMAGLVGFGRRDLG